MHNKKEFPEGMVPLNKNEFQFSCHAGVTCFMSCCKNVDMILYPYDIIRLKNCLHIDSEMCMRLYTRLVQGDNPYFPTVKLKLQDNEDQACPFLAEDGCTVYRDRPSACRSYPLERAVERNLGAGHCQDYYFLTNHSYCLGHQEKNFYSVAHWKREQQLDAYNNMNDLWVDMDTIFATNPWKGEGKGGPKQQMAFMVSYDIDGFRSLVLRENLLEQFRLTKDLKRRLQTDDSVLLQFGFDWLKLFLTGSSSLIRR